MKKLKSMYFVYSHEHGAFWKAMSQGYTNLAHQYGLYSEEHADQICSAANYMPGVINEEKIACPILVDALLDMPHMFEAPDVLVKFLEFYRQPARKFFETKLEDRPKLYATDNEGLICRVVMASRLGDVGINYDLDPEGYSVRVTLDQLFDYREKA